MEQKLSEQEIVRREKAEQLKELGIDPYGHRFDRTHNTLTFKNQYGDYTKEELHDMEPKQIVKIAGRVMT